MPQPLALSVERHLLNRANLGFRLPLTGFARFGAILLVTLAACGPSVEGHSVATHTAIDAKHIDASQVRLSAVSVPEGASELGIVQAHTVQGSIEDAVPEFRNQVAQLGGDFGKIDNVATKFETYTQTRTESYSCGTVNSPRTCTRTVTETREAETTRIIGKAYRLGGATATASKAPGGAAPRSDVPLTAPPATPSSPERASKAP